MADVISVTTLDDPVLAPFARLTERQLRSKIEPELGIFIAESPKVIHRALDAGYEPLSLLMERRHIEGQGAPIIQRCAALAGEDFPVYTGEEALLAQLAGYPLTRGVLCAMRRPVLPTVEALCQNARRVAVLEDIVDHTNIGAIFRSAAALGMDAVLLTPSCCDPLYRRSARVSMGTVFQVPWTRLGDDPAQWPGEGLERLHALGFLTVATRQRDGSFVLATSRKSDDIPLNRKMSKQIQQGRATARPCFTFKTGKTGGRFFCLGRFSKK